MLVKYQESETPIRKEHSGFTFQNCDRYNSISGPKKNDRWRYPIQNLRRAPLIKLAQKWRELPYIVKLQWESFAESIPQPANFSGFGFLSGYECYLRRNYWQLVNFGINAPLIESPALLQIYDSDCNLQLIREADRLLLFYDFERQDSTLISQIFLSFPVTAGRSYPLSKCRYVGFIENKQTFKVNFGVLYNAYTTLNSKNIAPAGWRVPTQTDFLNFFNIIGGKPTAGKLLKIQGTEFWNHNLGLNTYGFNYKGSGVRSTPNFSFASLKNTGWLWSKTVYLSQYCWHIQAVSAADNCTNPFQSFNAAASIRFLKNDSTIGPCVGYSGFNYPVIKIGNQVWSAENSIELTFNDGTPIANVQSNNDWRDTTTPAYCFFNNIKSNAFESNPAVLDVTELYKDRFGILPNSGQNILLTQLTFAISNGQKLSERNFNVVVQ